MKYSLSSRQSGEYLKKADEIKVQYKDKNIIFDLIEKYPQASIYLVRYYSPNAEPINWDEIKQYKILAKKGFLFGLADPKEVLMAKKHNIDFCFLDTCRTYQELQDLKRLGAAAVILGAPLFFDLKEVRKVGIPVRHTANVAHVDSFWPRPDGVCGTWIRPEDVEFYESYIETLEFQSRDNEEEQALYRIYAEQHKWPGELGLLVKDLNYLCTNRMVPPTLAISRQSCGQKCQKTGRCQLCYHSFDLANPDLLKFN